MFLHQRLALGARVAVSTAARMLLAVAAAFEICACAGQQEPSLERKMTHFKALYHQQILMRAGARTGM